MWGPFTFDECHQSLIAHNPSYAALRITQKPSWVHSSTTLTADTHSSLVWHSRTWMALPIAPSSLTNSFTSLVQGPRLPVGKKWSTQPTKHKHPHPSNLHRQLQACPHTHPLSNPSPLWILTTMMMTLHQWPPIWTLSINSQLQHPPPNRPTRQRSGPKVSNWLQQFGEESLPCSWLYQTSREPLDLFLYLSAQDLHCL